MAFYFDYLPYHIQEAIFKWLPRNDRFQTGQVSQEWLRLTLKSYQLVFENEEDLLVKHLFEFYNEAMQCDPPLTLPEFIGYFVKVRIANFNQSYCSEAVSNLLKYQESIEHLSLSMSHDSKLNLDQLSKFPLLKTLVLRWLDVEQIQDHVIPRTVKRLKIKPYSLDQGKSLRLVTSYFRNSEASVYLNISLRDSTWFTNERVDLRHVVSLEIAFDWYEYSEYDLFLESIRSSKCLQNIKMICGPISVNWCGLFPPTVKEIDLSSSSVSSEVEECLDSSCLPRSLLFFCCHKWQNVSMFKCNYLTFSRYSCSYMCIPSEETQEIFLHSRSTLDYYRNFVSLDEWPLQKLHLHVPYMHETLEHAAPASVQELQLVFNEQDDFMFSPEFVCVAPENLKLLKVTHRNRKHFLGLQPNSFSNMINLSMMEINSPKHECLRTILSGCSSLKKLRITSPTSKVFFDLSEQYLLKSLLELTVVNGDDNTVDILKHFPQLEKLELLGHPSKAINCASISRMQNLRNLIIECEYDTDVITLADSLILPYFVAYLKNNLSYRNCVYAASGWISVLRNSISTQNYPPKIVYAKGFSALYLRPKSTYVASSAAEFLSLACQAIKQK